MRTIRASALLLSLTTLFLAGSTLYLHAELRRARERAQIAEASLVRDTRAATPTYHGSSDAPIATPVTRSAPLASVRAASGVEQLRAQVEGLQARMQAGLLRTLEDPDARAQHLSSFKTSLRLRYPDFARAMRLSFDESERLLDKLAELQLNDAIRLAQCAGEPGCDDARVRADGAAGNREELLQFLGVQKLERYETYVRTLPERRQVAELRSRLSEESALRDSDAERLINALADRVQPDADQSGRSVPSLDPLSLRTDDGVAASGVDGLAEIVTHQQRLHERAMSVLNAAQLKAFDELQMDELNAFRSAQNGEASTTGTGPQPAVSRKD